MRSFIFFLISVYFTLTYSCVRIGREIPQNPEKGGVLAIGITQDFESLIPAFPSTRQDNSIFDLIYYPLIRVEKNKVYPGIASEWEFSEDLKTITFYIRKDAKWHDGQPVTASDFIFAYNLITSPNSNSLLKGNFRFVKNIEKISDYVLKIEFTHTYSSQLIDCEIYPLPEHILRDVPDIRNSEFSIKPIGNGPYKVVDYIKGDRLVLERFNGFFEKTGFVDRIVFKIYDTPADVAEALKMDLIDIGFSLIPEVILHGLKDFDKGKIKNYESNRVIFIGWNLKKEPFNNLEFRKIISGLLNVDSIIKNVFKGYASKAKSIIPPSIWAYDSTLKDLEKSNSHEVVSILTKYGYTKRKPFQINILYDNTQELYMKIAENIKRDLENTGVVKINLLALPPVEFVSKLISSDFDAFILSYPLNEKVDLSPLLESGGIFNFMGYSNKKVDSLLNLSRMTLNRKNAKKMLSSLQMILQKELPITPLIIPQEIFAFSNRIKNIENYASGILISNLDLVWIPSASRTERVSFEIKREMPKPETEVISERKIEKEELKAIPEEPKPVKVTQPEITAEELLQKRIAEEAAKKVEVPPVEEKKEEVSEAPKEEKIEETPPPQTLIPAVMPVVKQEVKPSYPDIAKKLGARGVVYLRVLVDETGRVKDVKVTRSSGYDFLDNSAVEAAKGYIFEPAKDQNGNPIAVWVPLTIRF
ncbi:MAG: TonB family protein [candidate division WOR-3 bacterium]